MDALEIKLTIAQKEAEKSELACRYDGLMREIAILKEELAAKEPARPITGLAAPTEKQAILPAKRYKARAPQMLTAYLPMIRFKGDNFHSYDIFCAGELFNVSSEEFEQAVEAAPDTETRRFNGKIYLTPTGLIAFWQAIGGTLHYNKRHGKRKLDRIV